MSKTSPPGSDELELSLFGPGIGESVVVHLGAGRWMVVDSCLDEDGKEPIALAYLRSLGVDVATQVDLIVVSHWHDDHVRGVSRLVREAATARFACSGALLCEEFMVLVAADRDTRLVEQTSGMSELAEVFQILCDRAADGRRCGPDHWATEGTVLYSQTRPHAVQVHALSPSSHTVTDAKLLLSRLLPAVGSAVRRLASVEPNATSVALLVTTPGVHLLLGGDLERGIDERRGWGAVLSSSVRPRIRSSGYKVAHHGSDDADLEGIWTELLVGSPSALVTPYARGCKPRPSMEDIARMSARTRQLYCTAPAEGRSAPRRSSAIERIVRRTAKVRRCLRGKPGHIRFRAPLNATAGDPGTIDLFDGAHAL